MEEYTVSGCIVTHNNRKCVRKAVETFFQCTKGVTSRLFIVDNGSTDDTVALLRQHFPAERFPNLEIIEEGQNHGFGGGHNLVLPKLHSKYHAIINPDIFLKDDVLTEMVHYMEEHEEIGLLSPRICFPDGREQILGRRNPSLRYLIASRFQRDDPENPILREYAMLDEGTDQPFEIEIASGCFMLLRTSLFQQIGGFDPRYFMYFEDADLTRTIRKYAKAVCYPLATVYHAWERGSAHNTKLFLIHVHSMLSYFTKWLGRREAYHEKKRGVHE